MTARLDTGAAARLLAARHGIDVTADDVDALVDGGSLVPLDARDDAPVYAASDLDAVGEADVAAVVADRQAWLDASLAVDDAAARLGWRRRELRRVAEERGIVQGRLGRYARADVDVLAADGELAARVDAEREIGPNQAADRLRIRRRDFDYVVAAGWVAPVTTLRVQVGYVREVDVPLYRSSEVDALQDRPDVDWDEVRAVSPGQPSPLRRHAQLPASRADLVRRFLATLGNRFDVDVWGYYRGSSDRWEIDWCPTADGVPTVEQVTAAVAEQPVVRFGADLRLATEHGAAVRWARAVLRPGEAVVLDTETTDLHGAVCEIAVIDTAGDVLLDTLVDPGVPIVAEAQWVHGIGDTDVAGAPTWAQVLPRLLEVTAGRTVVAYNSDYDRDVVRAECSRHELDPAHLADDHRWACAMGRRSDWLRTRRSVRLDGGHRALGDTQVTLEVLRAMTEPQGNAVVSRDRYRSHDDVDTG